MTTELWGGPYPLALGNKPPTQTKAWFNTVANQLQVWKWQTQTWEPVSPTVTVGNTPPSPAVLGQLYVDAQPKLWVMVDVWMELTAPVIGIAMLPANNAKLTASFHPPQHPSNGDLWFEPTRQDLSIWTGTGWKLIGTHVERNVRIAYPINTWNAGGNRTQAARAGDLLWIAGMRGIDPLTQKQVPGPGVGGSGDGGKGRIVQTYQNIKTIVESEGLTMFDCLNLFTFLTSAAYIGPTAQFQALPQFWGLGPYPLRTHCVLLQMSGSDTEVEFLGTGAPRGDIVEVTSVFFAGHAGRKHHSEESEALRSIPGVSITRT